MAKRGGPGNNDVNQLLNSLRAEGLDKLAGDIEKRLEKNSKLTKRSIKDLEAYQRANNKAIVENLKSIKQLEAEFDNLDDYQKEHLKNLKEQTAAYQKQNEVSGRFVDATKEQEGVVGRATRAIREQVSVMGMLSTAMNAITSLYNNWFSLESKWQQSLGQLAQRTGASRRELSQFRAESGHLRELFASLEGDVDGIAQATQFIGDAALGTRMSINSFTREFSDELLAVNRGLGMSGDQAGQLFRVIEAGLDGGNQDLGDFVLNMREFAQSIGGNATQIGQDFLESRDNLALFGRDAGEVFRQTTMVANRLGFSTNQLLQMARRFDSFRSASENVNQLNAMFGTTISSMELMTAENPIERISMITDAIRDQGLSWNDMSRYQQQALAQSLGVTESEAMRLVQGERMEDIQQEQQQRMQEQERLAQRQQQAQETLLDVIQTTQTAFRSWRDYLQEIFNDVSTALAPIFEAIHEAAGGTVLSFREWVRELAGNREFQSVVRSIAEWIRELPQRIREFLPTWNEIKATATEMWPTIQRIAEVLRSVLSFAAEHPGIVAAALGGLALTGGSGGGVLGAIMSIGSTLARVPGMMASIASAAPGLTAALAGAAAPLGVLAGAWAGANAAEDRRLEEGQMVSQRDVGTMARLQGTAGEEIRRRVQSGNLQGSDGWLTNVGEFFGAYSGQEADQHRNNIEALIMDYIRPGNKRPGVAARELTDMLGVGQAAQIARQNGASSFDDYIRGLYRNDPHLSEAFSTQLGLPPPASAVPAPTQPETPTPTGTEAEVSAPSAVDTAPATDATTSSTASASASGVQVVLTMANVYLDQRLVGRANVEASVRGT